MSQHWLWATVPLGLICLVILPVMVWRLIDNYRADEILSVPLVAEQELSLDGAGPMLLHGEAPRLSAAFGGLDFRLTRLADDRDLTLSDIWMKSSSSGFSKARLSLRAFELTQPGRYRLTVLGSLDADLAANHSLVITHDRRGRMVGTILAVVFSAIGLLGGLTLSLVIYMSNYR